MLLMSAAALAFLAASVGSAQAQHDTCGAASARAAVGMTAAEAEPIIRRAVDSADSILRVIRPGVQITLEASDQRLTVELDAEGRVKAVRCG